jgi:acyl carrier protein
MVPNLFVVLEALPLTPNGKVDRAALPPPAAVSAPQESTFVPPRDNVELHLVKIWEDLLQRRSIGVRDNFFDLGGHSLAETQIASRVLKQFQLEIPVRSFLASPTVAEMAAVIAEYQAKTISEPELERIFTEVESISETEAKQFLAEATRINSSSEPEE